MNKEALERMAKYIEVNPVTKCTFWSGGKDQDGYPMFWLDGKTERASRALWKILFGDIPDGMIVRHKCDNPECLEITHLELGTHKENTGDALVRGRMLGPIKVTEKKKQLILKLRQDGVPLALIATTLDISVSSLYNYLPKELKRKGKYRTKGEEDE